MNAIGGIKIVSPATTPQPRLVLAAREFEAQMMKELLQPMATKDELFRDAGEEGDASGVLGEYAAESLARGLSDRGGFGLGAMIVQQVSRSGNTASAGKVITFGYDNTGIKAIK